MALNPVTRSVIVLGHQLLLSVAILTGKIEAQTHASYGYQAVAVREDGMLYVATDKAICVVASTGGHILSSVDLRTLASSITIGPNRMLFVGDLSGGNTIVKGRNAVIGLLKGVSVELCG